MIADLFRQKYRKLSRKTATLVTSLFLGTFGFDHAAHAGDDFKLLGLDGDYNMQASYALAARLKNPANGIINTPPDPLVAQGLSFLDPYRYPQSANYDDGDRNFKSGSLINNRVTLLGELNLTRGEYGAQVRGDAFADSVYLGVNDNDSPSTLNRIGGSPNEFSSDARRFDGRRMRLLDAYAFGTWYFGEQTKLNVRAGRHVAAWGESLFFSGVALAQAPSDATKANVPGADVKSILLPVDQVSMQLSLTNRLTLLGQYKLEFKATELDPVGTYFSTSDVVGPGAQFVLGFKSPIGTPLPYLGNVNPSAFGQYGAGIKYSLTADTSIGLYRLRYHSTNPSVHEHFGCGAACVPVSYDTPYFDGIDMTAASFSTHLFGLSLGGEAIYREGSPTSINYSSTLTGNVATPVRSNVTQGLLNAIYSAGPGRLWDSISVAGEVGYVFLNHADPVNHADEVPSQPGIFTQLYYSRTSVAGTVLVQIGEASIFDGWDLNIPISYSATAVGQSSLAGAFGSLQGAGDERASIGTTFTYQQDFDIGVVYSAYFGSPNFTTHPYADRDNIGLNLTYRF